MNPETQALIETLEMFLTDQKVRRGWDTPGQAQEDDEYNWSSEMRTAMDLLERLKAGELALLEVIHV